MKCLLVNRYDEAGRAQTCNHRYKNIFLLTFLRAEFESTLADR
jgi:hypothetical protein